MRGYVNGLAVNTAIVNGGGGEGILFADTFQILDVLQGLFAVSVDVEAILEAAGEDVSFLADGTLDVTSETLAYIADQVVEANASSVVDADAVATMDHNMLTIFMREPLRRHAGAAALAPHAIGALLASRHPGGSSIVRH